MSSSLNPQSIARRRALIVAPPAALPRDFEIDYELKFAAPAAETAAETAAPPPAAWGQDVRFFVTCYLVGLIFFLVMLS